MDPARIQRALDSLIYLPLLKGRSAAEPPETEADALLPLPSVQARQCKPWDRGDLLRRLQSFQPATWFCKPACAGPVACARRGWANTGLDQLTCEVLPTSVSCVGVSTLHRGTVRHASASCCELGKLLMVCCRRAEQSSAFRCRRACRSTR